MNIIIVVIIIIVIIFSPLAQSRRHDNIGVREMRNGITLMIINYMHIPHVIRISWFCTSVYEYMMRLFHAGLRLESHCI